MGPGDLIAFRNHRLFEGKLLPNRPGKGARCELQKGKPCSAAKGRLHQIRPVEAGEVFFRKLSLLALGVRDGQMVEEQSWGGFAAIVEKGAVGEGNPAARAEHVENVDLPAAFCIPQPGRVVSRARQHLPPVQTKGYRQNFPRPLQRRDPQTVLKGGNGLRV